MRIWCTPLAACLAIAVLLAMPHTASAQSGIGENDIERVGQSGWQFLKINGDPRQAAMGNAFTAISHGDANAVFGNPASLADVDDCDLQINTVFWIADITHESIALAKNFGDWGVGAVSVATLNYGDMVETINSVVSSDGTTEEVVTGNTFSARDMALGVSYGRKITENLSIGGSARWIHEQIADVNMSDYTFDFGVLYYTGFKSLRIAMAARNFGPDSHVVGWSEDYQSEPYDVRTPVDFRVGVGMDFFGEADSIQQLTVSVEGDHPNDGPEKVHVGGEYTFLRQFSLRAGYKFNYDEQGLTLGAGVVANLMGVGMKVNYAFVNFGNLKQVHMFSLGIAL